MVKNGFSKWLTSTKFQIGVLGIILLYMAPVFFSVDPTRMAELIRDIVLGYFGARVAEPVVELAVNKALPWLRKVTGRDSANTECE